MTRYFVEQGSIYAPGWHVRETIRSNYFVSLGCFADKADAEEYLAQVQHETHWDEDLEYPLERWRHCVANGVTRQDYWDWVISMRDAEPHWTDKEDRNEER